MGKLSSCWYFIDFFVIPCDRGQRRWLVLRYFVHPFVFILCRFYMMAKSVIGSMLVVIYYPIEVALWVAAALFRLMMRTLKKLVLIIELDDASIIRKYGIGARRERWFDFLATEEDDDEDPRQSIVLFDAPRLFPSKAATMSIFKNISSDGYEEEEEEEEETEEAEWHPVVLPESEEEDETGGENRKEQGQQTEEEEITLGTTSDVDDGDKDAGSSSPSLNNEAIPIWQTRRRELIIEAEEDEFYKDYMGRMKFFDLINSQVFCGVIGTTPGVDMGSPAQLETTMRRMHTSSGPSGNDFVGSFVSSIETAYVAQSCLSWEALHHQYRKVETLASSAGAGECAFPGDVAAKFQHFRVLLERFMENDRLQGRRIWNYCQGRFSSGFLLQVPGVVGYVVDAAENRWEESLKGGELLKVVERAITTFQDFLQEDDFNQHGMKLKKPSPVDSRVENPNDLPLLSKLVKNANKKEAGIKDLSKRKRRWWGMEKKSMFLAGMDRSNELLFAAIDVKLVSRVLNMSNVSPLQLRWCEDKLNAIQVSGGFLVRNSTSTLFPFS